MVERALNNVGAHFCHSFLAILVQPVTLVVEIVHFFGWCHLFFFCAGLFVGFSVLSLTRLADLLFWQVLVVDQTGVDGCWQVTLQALVCKLAYLGALFFDILV